MKKFLPLLLLLLAPVWAAPLAEAATKTVSSEDGLKTALLSLASEDITEIVINSDITLTGALPEVSPDADLIIKKGTAETIDGANKSIFKVMKGKMKTRFRGGKCLSRQVNRRMQQELKGRR